MPIYDHDCKMYRFPSFHETTSCDQAKTAQESLRDILNKFPSNTSTSSTVSSTASPPSSSASSAASSPPAPPHPLPSQQKRPSNASDYKWISTGPRSSSSSASSKSSTSSSRNRKISVSSNGGRRSPISRSSIDSRHAV